MSKAKKRDDGRYQKAITVGHKDGKIIRRIVYGKTLKELEDNYIEAVAEARNGMVPANAMTMSRLCELYVRSVESQLRLNSRRALGSCQRRACGFIGDIKVQDLTEMDLEQMKLEMLDTPVMFNMVRDFLRKVLRYAVRHKIVARNVADEIDKIKYKTPKKRIFTDAEREAIQAAELDPADRALVDVLFYAGVRIGEALALIDRDIDFRRNKLVISKSVYGAPKTDAGYRSISMPEQLVKTLAAYTKGRPPGLLFPRSDGQAYQVTSFHTKWQHIRRDIFGPYPSNITPHMFRHNYASDLYKAGIDVKTAQYLLGHSDIKTTLDLYVHFAEEDVDIRPLEDFYDRKDRQHVSA